MTREFDVAISFLGPDEAVARQLRDELAKDLRVFLFTHNQEIVAGTDGVETFSRVFRVESEVVVVLYRDGYGRTRWTQVELEVIKQRFLDEGPGFLFVVMLDATSTPPPWFPDTRIRFNLPDFGIEQAVGAIKLRALERGAAFRRESSAERAQRADARIRFDRETEQLKHSEIGVAQVKASFAELRAELMKRAAAVADAAPKLGFTFAENESCFAMTSARASLEVAIHIHYTNSLDRSDVSVVFTRCPILIPGQRGSYFRKPAVHDQARYEAVRLESSGWCWAASEGPPITSSDLAATLIERVLAVAEIQGATA